MFKYRKWMLCIIYLKLKSIEGGLLLTYLIYKYSEKQDNYVVSIQTKINFVH
jgi:hypothetical protein